VKLHSCTPSGKLGHRAYAGSFDQRHDVAIEPCGQWLGEIRNSLIEWPWAEVMGRIDAIAPDRLRAKAKDFRFANKRDEASEKVVELPNPLPPPSWIA